MAARPLNEAVQQAEEAISGGNYRLAVETCRRVLGQFPEFATAHRLLAEAHLEEGDIVAAERAFNETLQRDPQSSAAYAGLATIAEGRGDINGALAYAQAAWEITPQRADLRDRVAALSERLYGKDGRLHLTRAALTSLHFRAGRWSRAAAEAASVLAEHPARVDVQLRMAEALWRRGSLAAAASACRAVLESAPSAVMALLMLADIERRQGNQETAHQLLDRAHAIDPDGVRAADLVTIGANDLAEFILPSRMPEFDDSLEATGEVERPRIAPAPDFSWTEPAETERTAPTDRLVAESPMTTDSSGTPEIADEGGFDVSLPDDAEIEAARPPAQAQRGYTSMLESLHDEGLTPFRLEGEEGDEAAEEFDLPAEDSRDDDVFSLVSDEEIDAARPPAERPHGYTSMLESLGESGLAPFEVEGEPGYPTEPSGPVASIEMPPAHLEAVDYGADLTAGWDDIDAEIERATPSGESSLTGYTGQLRDLDEIGVQPFSIESVEGRRPGAQEFADEVELDASYGDNLAFLDAAPESVPVNQAKPMSVDIDLTDGWATIDEEIQNAIPSETPRGYTDELNELTESGVEPFVIEADAAEPGSEGGTEIDTAEPSVYLAEDSVPGDLAAGLDLWTFESEPEAGVAARSTSDSDQVETETVTEVDLFDFADTSRGEDVPVAGVVVPEQPGQESSMFGAEPMELTGQQSALRAGSDLDEPVSEDVAVETANSLLSGSQPEAAVRASIAHLGLDSALFARARDGKAQLVRSGEIQGDLLLPGVEPPGPTLEMLEQMVQDRPDDQVVRRQFAGALLENEMFALAFAEYQRMFKQRVEFDGTDLTNLTRVAESGCGQQAVGHRLLGAIYRRSGNLGKSARHYQISLAGYRSEAGKEA